MEMDAIWLDRRLWILASMTLLCPLAFLRRLDSLKVTSYIALCAIAYLVRLPTSLLFRRPGERMKPDSHAPILTNLPWILRDRSSSSCSIPSSMHRSYHRREKSNWSNSARVLFNLYQFKFSVTTPFLHPFLASSLSENTDGSEDRRSFHLRSKHLLRVRFSTLVLPILTDPEWSNLTRTGSTS